MLNCIVCSSVKKTYIGKFCKRHASPQQFNPNIIARKKSIISLVGEGYNYSQIARIFQINRERVRQIVSDEINKEIKDFLSPGKEL